MTNCFHVSRNVLLRFNPSIDFILSFISIGRNYTEVFEFVCCSERIGIKNEFSCLFPLYTFSRNHVFDLFYLYPTFIAVYINVLVLLHTSYSLLLSKSTTFEYANILFNPLKISSCA